MALISQILSRQWWPWFKNTTKTLILCNFVNYFAGFFWGKFSQGLIFAYFVHPRIFAGLIFVVFLPTTFFIRLLFYFFIDLICTLFTLFFTLFNTFFYTFHTFSHFCKHLPVNKNRLKTDYNFCKWLNYYPSNFF